MSTHCYPAYAFAKRALQATTMAAIDAAARPDRDWLSRGMSERAALPRAERGAAKNPRHGLAWVMNVGSAAREKSALTPTADVMRSKHKRRDGPGTEVADPMPPTPRGWLLDDSKNGCWCGEADDVRFRPGACVPQALAINTPSPQIRGAAATRLHEVPAHRHLADMIVRSPLAIRTSLQEPGAAATCRL